MQIEQIFYLIVHWNPRDQENLREKERVVNNVHWLLSQIKQIEQIFLFDCALNLRNQENLREKEMVINNVDWLLSQIKQIEQIFYLIVHWICVIRKICERKKRVSIICIDCSRRLSELSRFFYLIVLWNLRDQENLREKENGG